MSSNVFAEQLKFDKSKAFYESRDALEQLVATTPQVAPLANLLLRGTVPTQAFTKDSMYNINLSDKATDEQKAETIIASCSKYLFTKMFKEGDTEPVSGKMFIMKSQIGNYYKSMEEWNKSIALLVGITHHSNSNVLIQELMTNNSYRLAKQFSMYRGQTES